MDNRSSFLVRKLDVENESWVEILDNDACWDLFEDPSLVKSTVLWVLDDFLSLFLTCLRDINNFSWGSIGNDTCFIHGNIGDKSLKSKHLTLIEFLKISISQHSI